jgi:transcriptional regulator with XRE-family HTH domain
MATLQAKTALVTSLLEAKKKSGKTYNQIAEQTGLTNAYVAQLFRRQAQLKPGTAKAFKAAVPTLTDDLIEAMQEIPLRTYDPIILQDPTIYRLVSLSPPFFLMHYNILFVHHFQVSCNVQQNSLLDIFPQNFHFSIFALWVCSCSVGLEKTKQVA